MLTLMMSILKDVPSRISSEARYDPLGRQRFDLKRRRRRISVLREVLVEWIGFDR